MLSLAPRGKHSARMSIIKAIPLRSAGPGQQTCTLAFPMFVWLCRPQYTTHLIRGKKERITILINHCPASLLCPSSSWTNNFFCKHGVCTTCLPALHPAGFYQHAPLPCVNTDPDVPHWDKLICRPCSGDEQASLNGCLFLISVVTECLA